MSDLIAFLGSCIIVLSSVFSIVFLLYIGLKVLLSTTGIANI